MAMMFVVALFISSCAPAADTPSASPSPTAQSAVKVDAIKVKLATLDDDIAVVGNFRAITEANISPKNGGLVMDVPVHLGQFVQAGAVLIQLDARDIEAQLAQDRADVVTEQTKLGLHALGDQLHNDHQAPAVRKARANLDNARLQWERNRNLYRSDLIAQKDLQDAKAAYLAAQADYQSALEGIQTSKATVHYKRTQVSVDEQKLRDTTIRAPFAGFISARNVHPGDYLQPGGTAPGNVEYMKLVTLDPIYATMDIPEMYSRKLREGQTLVIKTPAWPGQTFNGRVTHISPTLDPNTRTVKVDATVFNPGLKLKPGLYGNITLRLGQMQNVRMIPRVGQVAQGGVTRIFVVEQKLGKTVAHGVTITPGRLEGAWVQADGLDLTPSTWVIVNNIDKLYEGVEVKVDHELTTAPAVPEEHH